MRYERHVDNRELHRAFAQFWPEFAGQAYHSELRALGFISSFGRIQISQSGDRCRGDVIVSVRMESGHEYNMAADPRHQFGHMLLEVRRAMRGEYGGSTQNEVENRIREVFAEARNDSELSVEVHAARMLYESAQRQGLPDDQVQYHHYALQEARHRARMHRNAEQQRRQNYQHYYCTAEREAVDTVSYAELRREAYELTPIERPAIAPAMLELSRRAEQELRRMMGGAQWTEAEMVGIAAQEGQRVAETARRKAAQEKGLKLLEENLTPAQLVDWKAIRAFFVIGGKTGHRYKIVYGRQMNIFRVNADNRAVEKLCFLPQGDLVEGDVMLAQKYGLELQEEEVLKIANRWRLDPKTGGVILPTCDELRDERSYYRHTPRWDLHPVRREYGGVIFTEAT